MKNKKSRILILSHAINLFWKISILMDKLFIYYSSSLIIHGTVFCTINIFVNDNNIKQVLPNMQ